MSIAQKPPLCAFFVPNGANRNILKNLSEVLSAIFRNVLQHSKIIVKPLVYIPGDKVGHCGYAAVFIVFVESIIIPLRSANFIFIGG